MRDNDEAEFDETYSPKWDWKFWALWIPVSCLPLATILIAQAISHKFGEWLMLFMMGTIVSVVALFLILLAISVAKAWIGSKEKTIEDDEGQSRG